MKVLNKYDSTEDTKKHMLKVAELGGRFLTLLLQRFTHHDESKLSKEEKDLFDIYTPKLKNCTYGSEEYKQYLKELKPALEHHYANNSHHPEYYENGIDGMNLLDLNEMFIDWLASSQRHQDGDINKSIDINKDRFRMSEQLVNIFKNTVNTIIENGEIVGE